jgi:hypothetical protein
LPIAAIIIVFWNVAAVAAKAPPDAIKMAEELKVNLDRYNVGDFYECWFLYVRNGLLS